MPYSIVQFQETPNPNALKCLLDRKVADTPQSFSSPPAPQTHALAAALFAIPGVVNLLFLDTWITVGKEPHVAWAALRPKIQRVLRDAP